MEHNYQVKTSIIVLMGATFNKGRESLRSFSSGWVWSAFIGFLIHIGHSRYTGDGESGDGDRSVELQ